MSNSAHRSQSVDSSDSIFRRAFDAYDRVRLHRPFVRLELQSELLLQRGEECWLRFGWRCRLSSWSAVGSTSFRSSECVVFIRSPLQGEIVFSVETSLIDHIATD